MKPKLLSGFCWGRPKMHAQRLTYMKTPTCPPTKNIPFRWYVLLNTKNCHTRKWKRLAKVTYCPVFYFWSSGRLEEDTLNWPFFLTLGNPQRTGWRITLVRKVKVTERDLNWWGDLQSGNSCSRNKTPQKSLNSTYIGTDNNRHPGDRERTHLPWGNTHWPIDRVIKHKVGERMRLAYLYKSRTILFFHNWKEMALYQKGNESQKPLLGNQIITDNWVQIKLRIYGRIIKNILISWSEEIIYPTNFV